MDQPSPYEATRILDPEPDRQYLESAMAALRRRYPIFSNVSIAQSWAGFIDATPDAVPVISQVDNFSGLFLASGFSGHGFGISPGAAHLVADLVSGATPFVNPEPFCWSRFSDGSRPRPVTGV
jgi:glycine/D-amino acid oxidase-like deaminating enzyme